MEQMLADKDAYEVISKDPSKKLTNDLYNLINRWKKNNYIDELTYKRLRTTDRIKSRAYGLPKIHKSNAPLKIIVSSINSPLYSLSLFLHFIIKNNNETRNQVENNFQLVDKLSGTYFEAGYQLASLDVVSLFY